jgi:hypothetical protein
MTIPRLSLHTLPCPIASRSIRPDIARLCTSNRACLGLICAHLQPLRETTGSEVRHHQDGEITRVSENRVLVAPPEAEDQGPCRRRRPRAHCLLNGLLQDCLGEIALQSAPAQHPLEPGCSVASDSSRQANAQQRPAL